jgi:hypothetical protein
MEQRTLLLNQLAQGLRPTEQGIAWFETLADNEQLNTLRQLAVFCLQAGATSQDAQDSIRRADIRPTHTPAVLITRGTLRNQLAKITNLPQDERTKAFTLLIALLSIADERRRTHLCAGQCNHAWHHLGNAPG